MPKINQNQNIEDKRETNNTETKVIVSYPDKLELSMVQANELKHYELFQWLVTLLLPVAVGFWTAYFTLETKSPELKWSAIIFTLTSLLFIILSYFSRKKVFHGSIKKSINLSKLE